MRIGAFKIDPTVWRQLSAELTRALHSSRISS